MPAKNNQELIKGALILHELHKSKLATFKKNTANTFIVTISKQNITKLANSLIALNISSAEYENFFLTTLDFTFCETTAKYTREFNPDDRLYNAIINIVYLNEKAGLLYELYSEGHAEFSRKPDVNSPIYVSITETAVKDLTIAKKLDPAVKECEKRLKETLNFTFYPATKTWKRAFTYLEPLYNVILGIMETPPKNHKNYIEEEKAKPYGKEARLTHNACPAGNNIVDHEQGDVTSPQRKQILLAKSSYPVKLIEFFNKLWVADYLQEKHINNKINIVFRATDKASLIANEYGQTTVANHLKDLGFIKTYTNKTGYIELTNFYNIRIDELFILLLVIYS